MLKKRVFTPAFVQRELSELAKGHSHSNIVNALVERKQKIITDQKLSVFGYQTLYKTIIGNTINYQEESLFKDPRLIDNESLRQIKGDIDKNARLYQTINSKVNDAGDNKDDLKAGLEEIGLGEKFINDNFISRNESKWKELDYRTYETEIEVNKTRKLDLLEIDFNGSKLETWKRASDVGAKRKIITVVLEAERGPIDLRFRMKQGDPLLKIDQVKTSGDYKSHELNKSVSNHEKQAVLKAQLSFNGDPKFFQIKLKRTSSNENLQFNCVVVEKSQFNISKYFEKVSVEIRRAKGKLLIENIYDQIKINSNLSNSLMIQPNDDIIDCEKYGQVSFKELLEKEVSGEFRLKYQGNFLPVKVTGPVSLDSIKLPGILDPLRASNIFDSDRNPKFNSATKRAVVAGKEKDLSVDAKLLCAVESRYITEEILYLNEQESIQLKISDFNSTFPQLTESYKELYDWLGKHETLISLTNWPEDLCGIVTRLLEFINNELDNIPEGSLSELNRSLLKIGVYKKAEKEWLTPFHPLCLAYSLQLINTIQGHADSTLVGIPQTTLDKLNPEGLIPVLFDEHYGYAYSAAHPHNKLWLELVPQKQNNQSFVAKLVHEKLVDFTTCFDMLFKQNDSAPLLLNSINNQHNDQTFKGLVAYYKKSKNKAKAVHINLYDDELYETSFDLFSESKNIEVIRSLVKVVGNEKPAVADELIALIRKNVTYSKFTSSKQYDYAHLSFFKNNEKVSLKEANVFSAKTGIACQGLISGEASYLENGNYYTGFGQQDLRESNVLIQLASNYNQLLKPARDKTARYIKGVVPVLSVQR